MARIRMSAMALSYQIRTHFPRVELILHFTTRDRNLMGLQSDLLGAHALGIRNILCLTGDPPSVGDYPNVTAVYDTDSVGLMRIVQGMNEGTISPAPRSVAQRSSRSAAASIPTAEDLDSNSNAFAASSRPARSSS